MQPFCCTNFIMSSTTQLPVSIQNWPTVGVAHKVDQHQRAAATHIPRVFYQPHPSPPHEMGSCSADACQWGHVIRYQRQCSTGSHLQHVQQCLIHHAVASTTAAVTSLHYALIRSKNTLNNAGWFQNYLCTSVCVLKRYATKVTSYEDTLDLNGTAQ